MVPTTRPAPPLAPPFSAPQPIDADWILARMLGYVETLDLELYPAQEEAILEISAGKNVILNTPTGSGKSLVALAACLAALARGQRAYYTAPIKALVNEKFLALCNVFGAANVGLLTGDASVNRDANIICCTAEILSNHALRHGSQAPLNWVVMDEFHFYSDRERGVAWQTPLLCLPQARFLLMSATLGDTKLFERGLEELTGVDTVLVKSSQRPVPLDYSYVTTPLHETLQDLLEKQCAPIYVVHFSQRAASEQAQRLTSLNFLTREQKLAIREQLKGFRFDSAFGKELLRFIPHGIGVHHAGMLPKYRLLVEGLAKRGLLKVICGTDTLGVGVNVPLRSVLFTQLCKFDGDKVKLLTARDFHQIAGRAGRRGYDDRGSVVVQAPEHVIENLAMKRKAEGDAKKMRKLRLKKAPEKGFAPWDETTLERLRVAEPEPLRSRFRVSSGMLLNVLCRSHENGCQAMKQLIRSSHEPPQAKRHHAREALSVFRSLVEANVVELAANGVRVHAELQEDFSLTHALSLYAISAIESLDPLDRSYSLVMLSIVEAIVDNPGTILRQQVNTLKARRLAELKQQGVEYEERLAELEKVEYPKPEREFLMATFELFAREHPWILTSRLAPKSIARDMYEMGLSFNGYVKEYGLSRAEGVLLRYLSEVYRVLEHTVPEAAKTEEAHDLILWLSGELRATDSSLLEEWQRLNNPEAVPEAPEPTAEPDDITRDRKAFLVLVRNQIWRAVQAVARRDQARLHALLSEMSATKPRFDERELQALLAPYWSEYQSLDTTPRARGPKYFQVESSAQALSVLQTLVDPEGDLGWGLLFRIDLAGSREAGRPVCELEQIIAG